MGSLGGFHTCLKYLLFIINLIFWLVGCVLVGVGIFIFVSNDFSEVKKITAKISNDNQTEKVVDTIISNLSVAGYIVTAIGALMLITGFLGCCGAIKENRFMLVLYSIILFVLFAALAAAGIYFFVSKDKLYKEVDKRLTIYLGKERDSLISNPNGTTPVLKLLQQQPFLKCCGVSAKTEGYKDYYKYSNGDLSKYNGRDFKQIASIFSCDKGKQDNKSPGCTPALIQFGDANIKMVAIVTVSISGFLLLCVLSAMCLCCAIRDKNDY